VLADEIVRERWECGVFGGAAPAYSPTSPISVAMRMM
jgi:hypothetical protein